MNPLETIKAIQTMIDNNSVSLSTLYDCFRSITPSVIVLPLKLLRGESIIRVRINNSHQFFDDINELSYPPADKSKLMRASLPGHPMFYGSLRSKTEKQNGAFPRITAIYETSDELRNPNYSGKQIVTFSKWRIINPINVFALPISEHYKEYTFDALNIQEWWNNVFKPNIDENNGLFSEFIGDLMAKKGSNSVYEVTANFINYVLVNDQINYQGVIYPTQQLNGDGLNIAVTPSSVDSNCVLEHATTSIIIKENAEATIIDFADAKWDANEHIRWIPRKEVLLPLIKDNPEIANTLHCFSDE